MCIFLNMYIAAKPNCVAKFDGMRSALKWHKNVLGNLVKIISQLRGDHFANLFLDHTQEQSDRIPAHDEISSMMALLSNHHCNYQNTQSEVLTPAYPASARSYDPLYPSPYNSPNYDSARIAYRDSCSHENELTPRREVETLDYAKDVVSEYAKTPEGYDRGPYGVLTPVTPQRYEKLSIYKKSTVCICVEEYYFNKFPAHCHASILQIRTTSFDRPDNVAAIDVVRGEFDWLPAAAILLRDSSSRAEIPVSGKY